MMKELVMEATNTLPDTATFEDIIEAIYVRLKIEKGIIKDKQIGKKEYEEIKEFIKEA